MKMNKVLVCKLNNSSYEAADKETDKYYVGFEVNILQDQPEGWDEKAISTNGQKTYEIYTKENKNNTYNIEVYEITEQHEINAIKVDGDNFTTRINGSEKEIINHYNEYNALCDDVENIQIKEIEFIFNDGGFAGNKERKVLYMFTCDNKGLWQY